MIDVILDRANMRGAFALSKHVRDRWREVRGAFMIRFYHVYSHLGTILNERADQAAEVGALGVGPSL